MRFLAAVGGNGGRLAPARWFELASSGRTRSAQASRNYRRRLSRIRAYSIPRAQRALRPRADAYLIGCRAAMAACARRPKLRPTSAENTPFIDASVDLSADRSSEQPVERNAALLGKIHRRASDMVGFAERDARLAHQPIGEVGCRRIAEFGRFAHPAQRAEIRIGDHAGHRGDQTAPSSPAASKTGGLSSCMSFE